MAAVKKNITFEARASFRWRLTWTTKTGKAVNLTGWTGDLEVRATHDDPAVLYAMRTSNGGIVLGGTKGTIDLYASDEDTDAMAFEKGVYDLVLTDTNGDRIRLLQGQVTVSPGVTE